MREMLSSNAEMRAQLEQLERKLASHDDAIVGLFKTLHELMSPQRIHAVGFTAEVRANPKQR